MMVYLSTCALVFVWIATTQPRESLAFEQAIFKRNEQKYLADHVMKKEQAESELECGSHCIADKSCTSINYKISGIGKVDVSSTIRQLKRLLMLIAKYMTRNSTILLSSNMQVSIHILTCTVMVV